MKRMTLAAVVLAVAMASGGAAVAQPQPSRGQLMKACLEEWRAKSKGPAAEKPKYTAFLSECLKRRNAGGPAKPRP